MIPLIFASSMLILPWTISSYFVSSDNEIVATVARAIYDAFNAGTSPAYWTLYFVWSWRTLLLLARGLSAKNSPKICSVKMGSSRASTVGPPPVPFSARRITVGGAVFLGLVASFRIWCAS